MAALAGAVAGGLERPLALRVARAAVRRRRGLVQRLALSPAAETAISVVLLDYTLYLWHVLTHRVPQLWRFHEVHHADRDLDVTTGPKLAALLGDERFLALAEAYAREHPSDRPDLGQFGRHLPAFLLRFPARERADLADLAALEWARSEVFFEAPALPVSRDALAVLRPDSFLDARLQLVPALRVLALDHDAATLWRRLEDGEQADAPIANPSAVVVWREGFEVFHGRIELDEARALEAARAGDPLASVCAEFGLREDPADAAFAAFASWFDEGWIAAIST